MRDKKSILLALLAAGLVITWVYHLYDKTQYANHTTEVLVKDSSAVAKAVSDSLKVFFIQALDQLDPEKIRVDSLTRTSSDSVWKQKLVVVNQLRFDIRNILEQKDISKEDLGTVKIKLDTLQLRMIELENEGTLLNSENKKPNGELTQLSNEINTQQSKKEEPGENKIQSKKSNAHSLFVASGIQFAAYKVQPDKKEIETTQQDEANKFISSFTVKNNSTGFQNAEIIIVISDPSGKSVNPEVWDAGSFETRTEGKKVYTRKLLFEYNKGETKRLQFALEPENFEKGVYKISLYHNGFCIGQSSWKLG
ncbi:MAG TPA: hypothetical protein VFU29_14095 [Chitinophagaceae bacterium]|nr:hypothetical protein [Chitinophagaceae bacterium]